MTFKEYFESIKDSVFAIEEKCNGKIIGLHTTFYILDDPDRSVDEKEEYPIWPVFVLTYQNTNAHPDDETVYINPNQNIEIKNDSILVDDTFNNRIELTFISKKVIPHPISTRQIEFYSNTYIIRHSDTKIQFVIAHVDTNEGESEKSVISRLNMDNWTLVSEDTYELKQVFNRQNFDDAKAELISLGFVYKGSIDGVAIE